MSDSIPLQPEIPQNSDKAGKTEGDAASEQQNGHGGESQKKAVKRNPGAKNRRRRPTKRALARTIAFQVLYQEDLNPGSAAEFGEGYIDEQLAESEKPGESSSDREALRIFCKTLISGTRAYRPQIDAKLAATATHWSLDRMAATDRNVLRLAVYEMLYHDTPRPVVINEAVELARNFGSAESAAFVNGILDKIR